MRGVLRRLFGDERDVPLGGDASSRFLPWITGLMVYLAVVALAATMVLADASSTWRQGVTGTLTVQIDPDAGNGSKDLDTRTQAALKLLRETAGVADATLLSEEQLGALLAPWIGVDATTRELPVPRVIDVTLTPDTRIDTGALAARSERTLYARTGDLFALLCAVVALGAALSRALSRGGAR